MTNADLLFYIFREAFCVRSVGGEEIESRGRMVRKVIAMVCVSYNLKWAALSRFAKEMIHTGSHEWKGVTRNKQWLICVQITASVKVWEKNK